MSNQVDLESVGMGAKPISITAGKTARITVIIANNLGEIPKGEATAHITVNGRYVSVPDNIGFRHLDKKIWKLKHKELLNGNYELYFTNILPIGKVGGNAQGFVFTIRGTKVKGDCDITMYVSLSLEATVSDINGENQSAQMVITVK